MTIRERSNSIQVVVPQRKNRKYGTVPDATSSTPPKITALRPIGPATRISIQNQPSVLRRYIDVRVSEAKYHHSRRYSQSSRARSSTPCCRGSMTHHSPPASAASEAASGADDMRFHLEAPVQRGIDHPLAMERAR